MDERFKKVEDEYFRLKGLFAGGRITQEQFEAAAKELAVQDSQGRYWNLGPDSGKWYMHDGTNWVEADPEKLSSSADERAKMTQPKVSAPAFVPPSSSALSQPKKSGGFGVIAIVTVVVLLLVAAAGLFLVLSRGGLLAFGPTLTPTINAAATSAAQASSTAQAEASLQAQATATAQAQATLTALAQATLAAQGTATAQAQATSRAQQTAAVAATQQALVAYVDALIGSARKFYGPRTGVLDTPVEGNLIKTFYAEQNLKNFVAEARFYNPANRIEHKWDYGFGFRRFGQRTSAPGYRFYIDSNSVWGLSLNTGNLNPDQTAIVKPIASGTVKNFDVTPTGSNFIRLVVNEKSGFLYVNGEYVSAFDLSERNDSGDVWLGSGMSGGAIFPGLATRYTDFVISSLP